MPKFKRPGYTQIPNEIFDELMPSLSGAQFKILCLISRRTLGWRRESHAMSQVEIAAGTGLSKQGVTDAIKLLEEGGFIVADRKFLGGARPAATEYSLSIEEEDQCPNHLGVAETSHDNLLGYSTPNSLGGVYLVKENSKESNTYTKPLPENQRTLEPPSLVDIHRTLCSKFRSLRKSGGLQKPLRDLVADRVERVNGWSEAQILDAFNAWSMLTNWENFDPRHRINSFFSFLQSSNPSEFPVEQAAETATALPGIPEGGVAADSATAPRTRETGIPGEAETWNRLVPHGVPVTLFDWNMQEGVNLRRCRRHPQFSSGWDIVCQKSEAILSSSNPKSGFLSTFHWAIKADKNWWAILSGSYDGMVDRGLAKSNGGTAAGGKDIFDEAIALVLKGKKP